MRLKYVLRLFLCWSILLFQHVHGLDLYDFLLHDVTQAQGDYHARQYDAATGQFTTMDPLCEKHYYLQK